MSRKITGASWRLQAVTHDGAAELPEPSQRGFHDAGELLQQPGAFDTSAIVVDAQGFSDLTGFHPQAGELITAIAMTRTLAAHNLPASTPIKDYLPTYWAKGPNIEKISFAQLMTHKSGFRVAGSDTFYNEGAGRRRSHERQPRRVFLPEHELQPVQNPAPGHERRHPRKHYVPCAI